MTRFKNHHQEAIWAGASDQQNMSDFLERFIFVFTFKERASSALCSTLTFLHKTKNIYFLLAFLFLIINKKSLRTFQKQCVRQLKGVEKDLLTLRAEMKVSKIT